MRSPSTLRNAGLIFGAALFLSACSAAEGGDQASSDDSTTLASALTVNSLPDCAAIAASVGTPIADMSLLPSDDQAAWEDGGKFGLTCSWGNDEGIRAAAGEVLGPQEIAEIGAISLQIVVSNDGLTKSDAQTIGMAFEDGRADAIGAWVMADAELDRSSPLTVVAPQVIAGDISVAFASTGAWLNTPKNLSGVTNDWAIASAIVVHQMLE